MLDLYTDVSESGRGTSHYGPEVLAQALPYRVGNPTLTPDNEITENDVNKVQQIQIGGIDYSDVEYTLADTNRDGDIRLRDVFDTQGYKQGTYDFEPEPHVEVISACQLPVTGEVQFKFEVRNDGPGPLIDAIEYSIREPVPGFRPESEAYWIQDSGTIYFDLKSEEDSREITIVTENDYDFDDPDPYVKLDTTHAELSGVSVSDTVPIDECGD